MKFNTEINAQQLQLIYCRSTFCGTDDKKTACEQILFTSQWHFTYQK